MKAHKLFHHPVGVFSFGARWYLAALSVLVLVLVAVHFVIHIQAQEQARQLMYGWLGKAQVDVGEVRYHLLRNAMTLENISIHRGDDSLSITQMLVRADARALTSDAPHLGVVRLSGVKADIHGYRASEWQADSALLRIWRAVENLQFDGGQLSLHPRGKQASSLEFDAIRFKKEQKDDRSMLYVSAELAGASLSLDVSSLGLNSGSGEISRHGRLEWQGVRAASLMESLGWQPIEGQVGGEIEFSMGQDGVAHAQHPTTSPQGMSWQGRFALSGSGDDARHVLFVQGEENKEGSWRVDAQGLAWPLSPWAGVLPSVQGLRMQSGQWQGKMHVVGAGNDWRGESESGIAKDIQWRTIHGSGSQNQLKVMRYSGLTWNSNKREIDVHQADLTGLHVSVSLEEGGTNTEGDRGWKARVNAFTLQGTEVDVGMQRGTLMLAALQGQGSIGRTGQAHIDLASPKMAGREGIGQGDWSFKGDLKVKGGRVLSGKLFFSGLEMPLQQLRPVLPLAGSPEQPLSMAGLATLNAQAIVNDGDWQADGDLVVKGLQLSHAGDQLRAGELDIAFGPVGPGLPQQTIRTISMHGWQYITPMNPLSKDAERDIAGSKPERQISKPYWWATLLHDYNWKIGSADFSGGSISVGRPDSLWATDLQLHTDNLKPEGLSPLTLQGRAGGGAVTLSGSWSPLSTSHAYQLNGSLVHANPFFLNGWLQASGMPRLIRGRLSASLKLDRGLKNAAYRGEYRFRLDRGESEAVASPDDPLIGRFGYGLADVLTRLDDGKGHALVAFKVHGESAQESLDSNHFGKAMLQAIQAGIKKGPLHLAKAKAPRYEQRIRLHERSKLSHNERARLRKLWRLLRANKNWVVDLEPVWTGDALDASLTSRIRHTQDIIEAFMVDRGISPGRIFPVWPTQQNHAEDLGFIHVYVRSQK